MFKRLFELTYFPYFLCVNYNSQHLSAIYEEVEEPGKSCLHLRYRIFAALVEGYRPPLFLPCKINADLKSKILGALTYFVSPPPLKMIFDVP